MNYNIRCIQGGKTVRAIKDAKGHHFVQGMSGLLLVHLQNDERIFVNFDHFDFLDFSNGWAKGEAVAVEEQSKVVKGKNGNPVITGPSGAS